MSSADAVCREPLYLAGVGFGWYHRAPQTPALDCCAVICPAMAPEYTRSHRSLRHLADRLASRGVPAVRFDYHGSGDSPGGDLDGERWETWKRNVHEWIREARRLSGRRRVCLVGLRLGATLAALAAGETPVDLLVLWSPCCSGRTYLRELQAMALGEPGAAGEPMESAGAVLSAQTVASPRSVNLLDTAPRAGSTLIVARDDLRSEDSYGSRVCAERLVGEGYAGMMAEHQFTVVPERAISAIADWVCRNSESSRDSLPAYVSSHECLAVSASVEETLCRFGPHERLFGVLSRPRARSVRQAVVLFNAGSVHHVGPHGLYVALARTLADAGHACLRFDLAGIGDSVLAGADRENHPYPETAHADARAALACLSERFGYRSFVLVGLCSGAHTAFRAGAALEDFPVTEIVLINPLTFHWREGMSLETSELARSALRYRKAARDPRRWLRLLRGKVDLRALGRYLASLATPRGDPAVERDLRRLYGLGRRVTLILAEGDPGRSILMSSARRAAAAGLRDGRLRIHTIAGGDHTFSRLGPRAELIARLQSILAPESFTTLPHFAMSSRRNLSKASTDMPMG